MSANPVADPGSEHARRKLGELLATGRAIAFVGAGASAGLYPLWHQLIAQLADEAVARGLANAEQRRLWVDKYAGARPPQAVRGIREALQDGIYRSLLHTIFGPRTGSDGLRYTPVHEQMLQLPFRSYVTTNYDPGLLEARRAVRPNCADRDTGTWQDQRFMNCWLTDDQFQEDSCPTLFLHGYYERPDTIVLGAGEYREAYRDGLTRAVFEKLWTQQRLVFVGFGFTDAWLSFLADEVLTKIHARTTAEPRHIAIVGVPEDEPVSREERRAMQDQFHALMLPYPVKMLPDGGQDHSQLVELLRSVAPPERHAPPPPPPRGPVVPPQYLEWLSARCGEVELIGMDLTADAGRRGRGAAGPHERWRRRRFPRQMLLTRLGGGGRPAGPKSQGTGCW
jgi:hypothetical protein